MKKTKIVLYVLLIMSTISAFAGKMEDYGGFKARDYKKSADGKLYTSAGTEVKNFKDDLTTYEQKEYIEAVQMASSGYPDHRNDEFKNTSFCNGEFDASELQKIVDRASEKSPNSGFKVFEQPIRKYDDVSGRWVESGEKIYTITGKDDTRLCVRVFEKIGENGEKTLAVVYGGTDWGTTGVTPKLWVKDAADARDDGKQISHFAPTPQAYKDAATVLQAIVDLCPNTNINVYGHSEGGGEAMYSVLSTGVKNGKNKETNEDCLIKYYGVNSAGLNGLKTNDVINDSLTKEDIANNFTLIQNSDPSKTTMFHGEWCSTKAYQFGKVISIPDMGEVYGIDDEGKIGENTFLINGKNEKESLRDDKVTQIKGDKYSVNETGETVEVKSSLDNLHGVEETLWKMLHIVSEDTKKEDSEAAKGNEDDSPFDSEPETQSRDGNGQMCPMPGNGSTSGGGSNGTVKPKPSPNTRVRRGGGGDTKAKIW